MSGEEWDGFPENPKCDGWHWLRRGRRVMPQEWLGTNGTCGDLGGQWNTIDGMPRDAVKAGWRYVAPCPKPTGNPAP